MSEIQVYDTGDIGTAAEEDLCRRAGEILSSTWPQIMWEVAKQGDTLVVRLMPWKFDEDEFTEKEMKNTGKWGFAVKISSLARETASEFRRKIILAGGTVLDAWWFDTQSGRRIKPKMDQPSG